MGHKKHKKRKRTETCFVFFVLFEAKNLKRWIGFGCFALGVTALGQPAALNLFPNLESNIDRPLRYRPDGADFVIENGAEFFNRPLYGGNTAFRVDGGDKPEFVLYLPGRGGNLRLAVRTATGMKWLHDAASITTRYRPGELLYEIRDPLLGDRGVLRVAALAYHQTEGLIVRIEAAGIPAGPELVWAYGGVNGQRGSRDGDIGTERVPISQWFQLSPEFCKDNTFELAPGTFTLKAKAATIAGLVPAGSTLHLADAASWNDLNKLAGASLDDARRLQVLVGRTPLANGQPLFLSLQRVENGSAAAADLDTYKEVGAPAATTVPKLAPAFVAIDLPRLFAETEKHFAALREQVLVVTPDPFINASVGALNVAADAVWDEPQQAIMHGAIAWRTRLLGWRGPYALDALGWHDRARKHFEYWATRQNTGPIPEKLPPADEKSNLARNEAGLHSNGDLSNSHYDMNLVFIDALFRHLLWTGDKEFAKKMWPVIERHLAWERRLFRREFSTAGGEKLPLYEAYAAIWASDDLQYSGGGTAHASAYNYWHNRMAAQLAPLVGADPKPYATEADLIARGMRKLLWTGDHFAESKDWLGRQLVHPSAALWSFYHVMDAGLATSTEATAMARDVEDRLPHLPVRGPGVPGDLYTLATSNWLPYTWSLNNVTMNENAHAALGLWQAGDAEEAFRVLKGSLLASMFMGISPGNVGSMNYLDAYRRESQRDFADGSGVLARAIIEGLFGVSPDGFTGKVTIAPNFPAGWTHAQLAHPDLNLTYLREGDVETYIVSSPSGRFRECDLAIHPRREHCVVATHVGNEPVRKIQPPELTDRTYFGFPLKQETRKTYTWVGKEFVPEQNPESPGGRLAAPRPGAPRPAPVAKERRAPPVVGPLDPVDLTVHFNDRVTEIFRPGKYLSPRSPFVSLALPSQGIGYWAGHVSATAEINDTGLRAEAAKNGGKLVLPDGLVFATPGPRDAKNILFTSQWDNYPREATVPLTGRAHRLHLLMAGSTNAMQSRLDNGEVLVTYADGTTARLALRNPETWWPIEQDYFTDDYQFRIDGPLPTRVDLKTGTVRVLDAATFKGQGRTIPGGAATVLELALDPGKELRSLTVRALANDVVIGLMAATLER